MARFARLLDLARAVMCERELLERDFAEFKNTHHTNDSIVELHDTYHDVQDHGFGNGLITSAMAILLPGTRGIVSNPSKTGKRVEAWLNCRLGNRRTGLRLRAALTTFIDFMKEFQMVGNTVPVFADNWRFITSYDKLLS